MKISDSNHLSLNSLNLQTGDILLFDDRSKTCLGCWNRILKCYTRSRYSHVAMVLKNPTFITFTQEKIGGLIKPW